MESENKLIQSVSDISLVLLYVSYAVNNENNPLKLVDSISAQIISFPTTKNYSKEKVYNYNSYKMSLINILANYHYKINSNENDLYESVNNFAKWLIKSEFYNRSKTLLFTSSSLKPLFYILESIKKEAHPLLKEFISFEYLFDSKEKYTKIDELIIFLSYEKNFNHCKNIQKYRRKFKQIQKYNVNLKYLFVLDFEATCEYNKSMSPCSEIIEFPVIVIDLYSLSQCDKFHFYIEPTFNKELTKFCTELTGITQQMISGKTKIYEVLQYFDKWIKSLQYIQNYNDFAFVTCGDWDLSTCLKKYAKCKNIYLPYYFKSYINIKKVFSAFYDPRNKNYGMMYMLQKCGIPHYGRHHSGIDDVKNICNICIKMVKDGYKFSTKDITFVKNK